MPWPASQPVNASSRRAIAGATPARTGPRGREARPPARGRAMARPGHRLVDVPASGRHDEVVPDLELPRVRRPDLHQAPAEPAAPAESAAPSPSSTAPPPVPRALAL